MRFRDAILNDIYGEKISENIAVDNNGQLICSNCVLARTGYYDYRESELIDGGSEEKIVRVYRSPEEVFDKESIKSMNFKPLVNDHPQDNVTPESVSYLQKGFVINARRGEGEFSECLMADIVVTDPYVIDLIKSGDKRELSVGYTSDIEEKDGKYFMKNIRGNHVALCDAGRAGIAKIRDSKTVNDSGRINYDDDLVVVKKDGKVIYKGIEDYEPMKDENWIYDESKKCCVIKGRLGFTKKKVEDNKTVKDETKYVSESIIERAIKKVGKDPEEIWFELRRVIPEATYTSDKPYVMEDIYKVLGLPVNDSAITDMAKLNEDALSFKIGEYALSTNGFSGIITEVHPNFIFIKDKNGDEHLVEKRFVERVSKTKIQDEDFDESIISDSKFIIQHKHNSNSTVGEDGNFHFGGERLAKRFNSKSEAEKHASSMGSNWNELYNIIEVKDAIITDAEPSPSTIKLSNGSIVNFYGWAERNGYGATYYSVGTKTRGGFIFKAHFENEQLAKNYSVSSEESTVVVRSRIGITKSEVVDSLKKFVVKVNGKSYATNARTHADAVKKVSKVLSDSGSDKYYIFLEKLRKSGVTNMFGAAPYLVKEFGVDSNTARTILSDWMNNYDELSEKFNWRRDSIKDAKDCVITLEGKKYKCILYGIANDPNYVDVYIPELVDFYGRIISSPKDDKGYRPKDGKFFIEKRRFKKENPTAIADNLVESPTEEALKKNIATEVKAGKPMNQAVAIAKSIQKENKDTQSAEELAVVKYSQLKESLKELENEIDRNDNNPNYNLVSKSRELEKLQDEISKLKKDFGYALKDSNGIFAFGWEKGLSGNWHTIAGSDAVVKLDGRSGKSHKEWAMEIARQRHWGGFSIGRLESHDPNDEYAQSILPLVKLKDECSL